MTLREKFHEWLEEESFDFILLTCTIATVILITFLTLSVIMLATVIGGTQ